MSVNPKHLTTRNLTRAQLRGYAIVPMVTPFTAQGDLDEAAVRRLVEHIVGGGCQGLLVAGTTGEAVSMPLAMRLRLARLAVEQTRGRGVVFGGIGDNSFAHSTELAREYFRTGADAVVAQLPSYYLLNAQEMEAHFCALADHVEGPLYLYNIPQTTRHTIPLEVIERSSGHPRIVGIKDSEPDGARQEQLARMFDGREDFVVFCGSVALTSRAMSAGADGFVPGAGNIAPAVAHDLMERLVAGDTADADAAQQRIDSIPAIYQKGRPFAQMLSALKGMLEITGLCQRHMLPPLQPLGDEEMSTLRTQMQAIGLLR